jgi:hypothetical protein
MAGPNQLILTVDFEVFGNGSGSVSHCACKPLDRMARLVESHDGRLEIFVDALEFAVMETAPSHAALIANLKQQLGDMVRRGHHLQLHVHPQWDGAHLRENEWIIDPSGWRIGDLDRSQIHRLIERGHTWLREIVAENHQEYSCSVFRAGGWCIQPSIDVLAALRAIGLEMDSSVAPGMMNDDPIAWYDFKASPDLPWWSVDDEVTCLGSSGFVEVPIATGRLNPVRHIYSRVTRRREGEFSEGCSGTYQNRNLRKHRLLNMWQKFRGSHRAMLDYCTLSAELMVDVVEDWTGRFREESTPVPVVAIGHTKNFSLAAERELDKFLIWIEGQSRLEIGSYGTWREAVRGCTGGP